MRPTLENQYKDVRPGSGVRVDSPLVAILLLSGVAALTVILYNAGIWTPQRANGRPSGFRGVVVPAFQSIESTIEAANGYLRQREPEKAEAVLADGVAMFPADQELRVMHARTLMELKEPGAAYEEYVAALAIGPRTHELEFAAGTMANLAGQVARAAEHYSAAQAAQPRNAAYALYLAQVQRKIGDIPAAKTNLLLAANLKPDDAVPWGTLADIAFQDNNLDIALQHILKAREIQPRAKEWRLIEARIRKRKGDPETAIIVLMGMDAAHRREPHIVRLIAECFAMLDRPGDAGRAFAEASDARPDDADLAYEAATWYARGEMKEHALVYARRAISLGHAQAIQLVEHLGR